MKLKTVTRAFGAYVRGVWKHGREDDVLFLASGIAFDILLAIVPFVLLLVAGASYALRLSPSSSMAQVGEVIDRMLPVHTETAESPVHRIISDALTANKSLGLWSALTFLLLSTRLFTALRTVLAQVYDVKERRGIIAGKLFDSRITVVATLLFIGNTLLSAYLSAARSQGIKLLTTLGLRKDVMGGLEYAFGRAVAFAFIVGMLFAIYRYLPAARIWWRTAAVSAVFTAVLLELAKVLFTALAHYLNTGSFYKGTLAAIVVVVFWTYYAAVIFVLGAEVGHVYTLRNTRRSGGSARAKLV